MKYVIVCILFSMVYLACGAREESDVSIAVDLTPHAQEFVSMLSNGDYAGCVAQFDHTMKEEFPEQKLQEAWNTIQTQVGTFQKQIGVRQSYEHGYDVVYVTCQFEKRTINVKVVYNSTQEVTGLWFRPAS